MPLERQCDRARSRAEVDYGKKVVLQDQVHQQLGLGPRD
jgi:hypothetical protein